MSNNIPNREGDQVLFGANFFSNMPTTVLTKTGITAAQMTALDTSLLNFSSGITDVVTAKTNLKSLVQGKDQAQDTFLDNIRTLIARIYATPTVTDAELAVIGLAPRRSRSTVTPRIPLDLVATPNANGTCELRWKRNGNPRGSTLFIIEKLVTGGDWTMVATATKANWRDEDAPAGEGASYRVKARAAMGDSNYSFAVTIYGGGEGSLSISQAA